MTRVRTVRGVRAVLASPIASVICGLAFAFYLNVLVSLSDVLANTMAHVNWSERFSYVFSSLVHSRFIVQGVAVAMMIASCAVLVNCTRKIRFVFGSTQQV